MRGAPGLPHLAPKRSSNASRPAMSSSRDPSVLNCPGTSDDSLRCEVMWAPVSIPGMALCFRGFLLLTCLGGRVTRWRWLFCSRLERIFYYQY